MFYLRCQRKDQEVIRSADHGSVTMLAPLFQQCYTRHKRNFRKLTTALEKDVTNAKSRFQKKGQPQQGPNKHRTSKYTDDLQSIEHVSR